jgi:hypothetical protein
VNSHRSQPLRVLVACECSGTVRDAFNDEDHDAWSCDIKPSEKPGDNRHRAQSLPSRHGPSNGQAMG